MSKKFDAKKHYEKLSQEEKDWVDKNAKRSDDGAQIVDKAIEEAMDWLTKYLDVIEKLEHRKFQSQSLALEIGLVKRFVTRAMPMIDSVQFNAVNEMKIREHQANILSTQFAAKIMQGIIEGVKKDEQSE